MNELKKFLVLMVGSIACITLVSVLFKGCQNGEDSEELTIRRQLEDSVQYFRNKAGQEVAQRKLLELTSFKQLQDIQTQDATINRLKGLLTKRSHGGTVVDVVTRIDTLVKTDTVFYDRSGNPVYKPELVNKWVQIYVTAAKDSSRFQVKMLNELNIAYKDTSDGFLRPKKTVVQVIQLNPYSSTKNVASAVIKPKKRSKFVLGLAFLGGLLIGTKL